MRRSAILAMVALGAQVLASIPSAAFFDAKTGLAIELPASFRVKRIREQTHDKWDLAIEIESTSGKPTPLHDGQSVCGVDYRSAPQDVGLSQSDINARMDRSDWRAAILASYEAFFFVEQSGTFDQEGLNGIDFVVRPRAPGEPFQTRRVYTAIWETPKGRVVVSCGTTAGDLPGALDTFRALRRSVKAPR